MSYEEIGKYIKLLAYIHTKGGSITEKEFFQVCSREDSIVIEKFKVDGEGNYYNERLLSEIRKRSNFTESRRNNLKGSKKNKNATDMDNHMSNHMEEHMSVHMENENEDTNILNNSNTINDNNTVLDEFLELIETEFKRTLSSTEIDKINYWFDKVGYKYLEHALRETIINRKTSVAYMEAILKDWTKKEITVEMLNQGIRSR